MRSIRNFGYYFISVFISVFIYLIFVSPEAYAASVLKSNAKQAIIQLDDLEFNVTQGDQVVAIYNSKRVGILKILQISAGKAKANILKGKAPVGAQVVSANGAAGGPKSDASMGSARKWHYGGVVGYLSDSQTTTIASGTAGYKEDISQTGTGYAAKGFGEIAIAGNLWFQGRFGIETFNVAGSSIQPLCNDGSGTTTACSTKITYVDGDALLKYNFPFKKFTPFAAFGLGLFFPVTKSSTALNSIPTISVFFLDLGADIQLGEKSYLPIYFEYGLFPPSNQVKTNYMGLMVGYGIRL